ncbi:hypothetical protein F511_20561 [Dorcoceras hygrometricum]|uniref:Uncharacterized protein n=1 Tax=Dorcoceras hygrometricum TaxID=472368 RepID=A0A2Z7BMD9_9LAMI|nr:hypothetical protein F511_20561 [Dorcoceras hygrometricum]
MILTVQKLFHHVSHTLFKFHLDPKYATSEDLYLRDPLQVATRKEIKHCHHVSQVLSSKHTQQKFSSNANSAATQIQQQHKFSGNANSAVGHSATQIKRLEFSDATFGSWTFGDANSAAGDLATQTSSSPRNFIIQISPRNSDFTSKIQIFAHELRQSLTGQISRL